MKNGADPQIIYNERRNVAHYVTTYAGMKKKEEEKKRRKKRKNIEHSQKCI